MEEPMALAGYDNVRRALFRWQRGWSRRRSPRGSVLGDFRRLLDKRERATVGELEDDDERVIGMLPDA